MNLCLRAKISGAEKRWNGDAMIMLVHSPILNQIMNQLLVKAQFQNIVFLKRLNGNLNHTFKKPLKTNIQDFDINDKGDVLVANAMKSNAFSYLSCLSSSAVR